MKDNLFENIPDLKKKSVLFVGVGNAIKSDDAWEVTMSDVVGIYLFRIPNMGFLSNFIADKRGWFLVIILPAIFLIGLIVKDMIKESFNIFKSPFKRKNDNSNLAVKF